MVEQTKQLTNTYAGQVLKINNTQERAKEVFDLLDVSETTRADYKYRIGLFLDFTNEKGFNHNSFLEFKRALAERTDLAISTKNKYLATARVFLKEFKSLNEVKKYIEDVKKVKFPGDEHSFH